MAIGPVTRGEHANDGLQVSVLGGVQDASLRSRRTAAGLLRCTPRGTGIRCVDPTW